MFRHVPDHVRTWRVMFSMFSMFRACLEELNMLWTWHSKFHVQIVFRSRHLCSNHVWSCSACSEPVQIILNMKILNMIFMFQNMFFMFLNMTEHAETWLSCSEHDSHVLNKTVMFCTWHVMFWTRMSCSKHDSYVLNMTIMFLTSLSCSVMFQHVPKQYSSAKSKCSITGFEHKRICIGVNCTNHSTQGLFCKFGREKGLYQNRNLRWFQIENLKWCHTTPSCFTLSQNTISTVLMWVLYYKLNSC